ncbi:hypothetical protein [Solibacillus daqui]|uniref:hypothetical protein n=1 Tax=Solibacillus daqui TaxID=2912187 RepID=UPI002366192A|nr:hypothetical protein [Solibacillus daqui]
MKKIIWGVLFIAVVLSPWWLYYIKTEAPLDVIVLDVSSTNDELKERMGIYEALALNKVVDLEGDTYEAGRDYFGVKVVDARKTIETKELPLRIDKADIIYLADLQGIHERDLSWENTTSNKLLFGGLTGSAWRTIQSRLHQTTPSTLIVEYNSFTDATEATIREQLAAQLGIEQSGYRAKYFSDLSEAPLATRESGSGLVIQQKSTNETVVLKSAKPVQFQSTARGEQIFDFQQFEVFTGWFDLAIAVDSETLATYEPDISAQDSAQLQALNLPASFAVITTNTREHNTNYYFAGKFSYQSKQSLPIPKMYGYKWLQQLFAKDDAFYWKNYEPMLQQILKQTSHREQKELEAISVEPETYEALSYNARIANDKYEVLQNGQWKAITIKGVNIGMAKPGAFPGEAAITKSDYADWFKAIGEMGSNAIRVYTVHPPGFYEALLEYNTTHEQPLYLFHGVWLDEEPVEEKLDVYGEPTENFQQEIRHIVDIIHGNATIEPRPGHASGTYKADVSPYILGWMIGIEWYPKAVENVNKVYKDQAQFNGTYFSTKDAQPFEIWLAQQMDYTASYEAQTYKWMRPFSFTNWVTTDLLEHPYEPSDEEDLVSVDPNVIYEKGALEKVGQFASYHVYPYYPDFLNYTPKYVNYTDHRGQKNNYAAYLKDLHAAHRMPILISEFGIPASRGLTHRNPFGWNQGFISEREQGEILVHLYEDILHEGLLGGLVFTWQDEWFKRTWNTMDLDNPDERPYWSNAQTNEQQFGVLSFDTLKMKVDGDSTDWYGITPFYESEELSMYVESDERYLYMKLDVENTNFSDTYYPLIYMNTLEAQGNSRYHEIPLLAESEFVLTIKGDQNARVEVDAYYDIFQKLYSEQIQLVPFEGTKQKNSGQFNTIDYALNKSLTIPISNITLPFEKYETGILRRGNGNPNSTDYDSLADYEINEQEGVIEIRIPWLLLNVTDPSRLEVRSDLYANEQLKTEIIDGIELGAVLVNNKQIVANVPKEAKQLQTYSWKTWRLPEYKERLKESYYLLQEKFLEDEVRE